MKVKKIYLVLFSMVIYVIASCDQNVEVSEEMKEFLELIDTTHSMYAAVRPFNYNPDEIPLDYFELKNPTITASSNENGIVCYDVNIKHGFIESFVRVCWSENKIIRIIEIE